jgi:hypothetical protein
MGLAMTMITVRVIEKQIATGTAAVCYGGLTNMLEAAPHVAAATGPETAMAGRANKAPSGKLSIAKARGQNWPRHRGRSLGEHWAVEAGLKRIAGHEFMKFW